MANRVAIIGAITGPMHNFSSRVLTAGRSLHPLQRIGSVSHSGYPSVGAASVPGFQSGPPAAPNPLTGYPPTLNISIVQATGHAGTRVS